VSHLDGIKIVQISRHADLLMESSSLFSPGSWPNPPSGAQNCRTITVARDQNHFPAVRRVPQSHSTERRSLLKATYRHVGLILLAGLLVRIPFCLAIWPIWSGDTAGYVDPYAYWVRHRFYLADRTPVYPLFLGLAQWVAGVPASIWFHDPAEYATVYMQSALDLVAACVLYFTLRKVNVRRSIAITSAVFAVTLPALCWFELKILPLSLSFALLVLCASVFSDLMKRVNDGSRFVCSSLLCGLLFSCAALLRTENLVFCTILATVLLGSWAIPKLRGVITGHGNRAPVAACLIILSAAPPILAWMTWNYVGIGEFRITTLTGWNQSKTVYNIFDRVDPEDRLLGQALTASYLRRNRSGIIVRDHVWNALYMGNLSSLYRQMPIEDPTDTPSAFHAKVDTAFERLLGMQSNEPCDHDTPWCRASIRKRTNIGDYVGRVSWKLIRKYPLVYSQNAIGNFVEDTFSFRYADNTSSVPGFGETTVGGGSFVKNETLPGSLESAINLQAPLLTVFYVVTLGFVVFAPLVFMSSDGERLAPDITVTGLALATVATFIAMCFFSGYNKEYSIPHLGIMLICTAYAVENWSRIAAAMGLRLAGHMDTTRQFS